jgi:signal transduction histidine kinase
MRRSWTLLLLIAGLAGLLVVLGVLQYRWQTRISADDGEKLTKSAQDEVSRFAEDFNREIQGVYFNLQTDADIWRAKYWNAFNERYDFWQGKTAYPKLIKDVYFFEAKGNEAPLRYDRGERIFKPVEWTADLTSLRARFTDEKELRPIFADIYTLALPIHDPGKRVEEIVFRRRRDQPGPVVKVPPTYGFLAVVLDERTIKEQVLRDLTQKHFQDGEFNISIVDKNGQTIFQTQDGADAGDASTGLFDLTTDNFIFYANKDLLPRSGERKAEGIIVNQKVESHTISRVQTTRTDSNSTMQVEIQRDGLPRTSLLTTAGDGSGPPWTLRAQHRDGSIAAYVANTRFRNLSVGFGIIGLLGLAVGAIIFSAQRARVLAQRQVDFVSSVSHEFRTPLAVIYSAGENLADGVAKDDAQVSRYGSLIKGEGRKLSAMVEQILTFAGARSGRKKYNFTETDIGDVVANAIRECKPLIEEKNIAVETNIADGLPMIDADRVALSQAIQNLIVNAVKYSNGERWLRVVAENGNQRVKISVEDKGLGISKSDLRQIFEPFFRAKEVVDAQIHGNGLGLSLVRQTAEAHGGKVSVASEPGKGSRFTIELPTSEPPA